MKFKHCPACYNKEELYFANGWSCSICGRRKSLFLQALNTADKKQATELERLRKIEAAAVACTEYEQWTGGTFYDLMIELQKALHDA